MPLDEILGDVSIEMADSGGDGPALVKLDISHPVQLRISAVERLQVSELGEKWSEAGVYLLLERPSRDGEWEVYVGKSAADGGVKKRLLNHLKASKKHSWYRAVAVCPSNSGWDEAEVAFLERLVYQALRRLPGVTLSNSQEPGKSRLAPKRQKPLLKVPEVLAGVLAMLGHSGARSDTQSTHDVEESSRLGKLANLVQAGLVDAGTKVVTLDKRWPGEGTITADGCIHAAGETHRSPSAAARAISKRQSESGWTFWAVESTSGPTLHELRDHFRSGNVPPRFPELEGETQPEAPGYVGSQSGDQPDHSNGKERADADGSTAQTPTRQDIKLADLVAVGLIPVGTTVVSTSRKWPAEGRILGGGLIEIGGDSFESPSAAASAIAGGTSVNGWTFWAINSPEGKRLSDVRDDLLVKAAPMGASLGGS